METTEEKILSSRNNKELVWRPGKAMPLVMRKRGQESWRGSCFATEDIYDWATAPEKIREIARRQWTRAGQSIDESTLADAIVAKLDGLESVLTIRTPEILTLLRPLLAEQRKVAAAAKAKREAEEAARQAEYAKRRADVIAACPEDCEPCGLGDWFDGVQTYIAPDGTKFEQWDGIDNHGVGVCYIKREVIEEARRRAAEDKARAEAASKEREAKAAAEAARRADCFRRARETGERVKIESWVTDRCHNGNDEDCSFDNAIRWAMPDGTEQITYTCCY